MPPTTRAAAKKNVESQGGKNRRLQALFVAAFVLPQLAVWASSTDYSAYVELFELLRPVTELRMRLHYADNLRRGSNNSVLKERVHCRQLAAMAAVGAILARACSISV